MILLLAWLWLMAAVGAGRTLLRVFAVHPRGQLESLLLSLMLGFPMASYIVFALGSAGWLTPAMVGAVFVVLLIVGLPSWRRLNLLQRRQSLVKLWSSVGQAWPRRWVALGLAGVVAFVAGLNLIGALAPPTEWDSLQYHLAAPAYYVRQGHISFVPYRQWNHPFTAEMWNVLGLLLDSDRLPHVFQWTMGLASAAALYLLAAGRTSRRTGLLAATLYYTSPHMFSLCSSAKSDLAWFTFLFLSLHSLLAWREQDNQRWLWLSAIFTGLSMGTKVQGLFWAPSIGLALVVLQWSDWRRAPQAAVLRTLAYGAIAVLVVSPWWLRNWLASGDPIWPYGYAIFHSRFWTQELYDKYAAWTQGPGDSAWYYVTNLWYLTVNQSAWLFGLRIPFTPVVLAFIPGLALVWPRVPAYTRRFFGLLLVPVCLYYTFWFKTYQATRYFFPALALLMIPAAYSFGHMTRFRWSRWASGGLLVSSFAMFLGFNVLFNAQFAPVVFGLESRDEFLARKVSFYDDIMWLNENLPTDARVLFFHGKTFYLRRDFVCGDRNVWPIGEQTTADGYLDLLQKRGITHLFVTPVIQQDSEFAVVNRLIAQLEANGSLVPIYVNPASVQVESRTLAQTQTVRVGVLRVVYPTALRR